MGVAWQPVWAHQRTQQAWICYLILSYMRSGAWATGEQRAVRVRTYREGGVGAATTRRDGVEPHRTASTTHDLLPHTECLLRCRAQASAQSALTELSQVQRSDTERATRLSTLQSTQEQLRSDVVKAEVALSEREATLRLRCLNQKALQLQLPLIL